jgi:hypothetical protein
MGIELTGLLWLAVEGFNSRIVNVVLFALALSAEKTARFPVVNAARTSIGDAASRAETANIAARANPPRFSAAPAPAVFEPADNARANLCRCGE